MVISGDSLIEYVSYAPVKQTCTPSIFGSIQP